MTLFLFDVIAKEKTSSIFYILQESRKEAKEKSTSSARSIKFEAEQEKLEK